MVEEFRRHKENRPHRDWEGLLRECDWTVARATDHEGNLWAKGAGLVQVPKPGRIDCLIPPYPKIILRAIDSVDPPEDEGDGE